MKVSRVSFGGVEIDLLTVSDLTAVVKQAVTERIKIVIGHHNLHSAFLMTDPSNGTFRQFYREANLVHADGMGIIWMGRMYGLPCKGSHRTGYLDWRPLLFGLANELSWRIFYVGGRTGDGIRVGERLRAEWPKIKLDYHHGFFQKGPNSDEERALVKKVNAFEPDLLLVGLGMPLQEHWILRNRPMLDVPVILPCGGFFDYLIGRAPTPPRWVGRLSLEWAYRTITSPRRLVRRNLVQPWKLLARLTEDAPKPGYIQHRRLEEVFKPSRDCPSKS